MFSMKTVKGNKSRIIFWHYF